MLELCPLLALLAYKVQYRTSHKSSNLIQLQGWVARTESANFCNSTCKLLQLYLQCRGHLDELHRVGAKQRFPCAAVVATILELCCSLDAIIQN